MKTLLKATSMGCLRVVRLTGLEVLYVDKNGRARTAYLERDGDDLKVSATTPGFPA